MVLKESADIYETKLIFNTRNKYSQKSFIYTQRLTKRADPTILEFLVKKNKRARDSPVGNYSHLWLVP